MKDPKWPWVYVGPGVIRDDNGDLWVADMQYRFFHGPHQDMIEVDTCIADLMRLANEEYRFLAVAKGEG
jgi:hypothetical protein